MDQLTVSIDDDGNVTFLVSEMSRFLVDDSSSIKRASHVEPVNGFLRILFYMLRAMFGDYGITANLTRRMPCLWRVNLAPVNGPVLSDTYRDRQQAISAEIVWLETNFL